MRENPYFGNCASDACCSSSTWKILIVQACFIRILYYDLPYRDQSTLTLGGSYTSVRAIFNKDSPVYQSFVQVWFLEALMHDIDTGRTRRQLQDPYVELAPTRIIVESWSRDSSKRFVITRVIHRQQTIGAK